MLTTCPEWHCSGSIFPLLEQPHDSSATIAGRPLQVNSIAQFYSSIASASLLLPDHNRIKFSGYFRSRLKVASAKSKLALKTDPGKSPESYPLNLIGANRLRWVDSRV